MMNASLGCGTIGFLLLMTSAAVADSACIAEGKQTDVCAIAKMAADNADQQLPQVLGDGLTAVNVEAEGVMVITTIRHELSMETFLLKLKEESKTLEYYNDYYVDGAQEGACAAIPQAAFIGAGGRLRIIFETSDNKVIAVANVTECFGS